MNALAPARTFTPSEAAIVSGVALKRIHNAIDKHVVELDRERADYASRVLSGEQLIVIKFWVEMGDFLNENRRALLTEALALEPALKRLKLDRLVILDLAPARKEIEERTRDLDEANRVVERRRSVMGGEPVFKGTRIPVRLIAQMLDDGTEASEILEGYPALDRRKIELARIWSAAHPRRGRPKTLADRGVTPREAKRVKLKSAGG